MATRLVFLCEVCLDAGIEQSGRPFRLGVDDDSSLVDLCDEHEARWVHPLRKLVAMGRDEHLASPLTVPSKLVDPVSPMSPNYYPCAGCIGTGRTPYGSASGLGAHLAAVHGIDMTQMHRDIATCRVRGCPAGAEPMPSIQTLAQHVRATHQYANVAVMLHELARSDPETVFDVVDRLLGPVKHDEADLLLSLSEV